MTRELIVHRAGPGVSVQDLGRTGFLSRGLSRGGAADRTALAEGAALLGQPVRFAALEMMGAGGRFEVTTDMRIALTGAPMRASCDGAPLAWNARHSIAAGSVLDIGSALRGVFGYLHLGGGIATEEVLGGRSVHFSAGIGAAVTPGVRVPIGQDAGEGDTTTGRIEAEQRFDGGVVRVVKSLQSNMFSAREIARFEAETFRRDVQANRMAVKIVPASGRGLEVASGLTPPSETVVPGDIQITGDGTPYVLMCECQTTGGYPRIGAVLPSDLPRVAQAATGATLRFSFVSFAEAVKIEEAAARWRSDLPNRILPLIRDPHMMADLSSYQLIGGVIAGDEPELM